MMGRITDDYSGDPDFRVVTRGARIEVAEHLDDTRVQIFETTRREDIAAGQPYLVQAGTWLMMPARSPAHARALAIRMYASVQHGERAVFGPAEPVR